MQKHVKEVPDSVLKRLFSVYQHYYVRDEGNGNVPVGTVAIARTRDSGVYCRGISICSTADNFSRKEGRALAYRRLVDAATTQAMTSVIHDSWHRQRDTGKAGESVDRFLAARYGISRFKSEADVALTVEEKQILETKSKAKSESVMKSMSESEMESESASV